MRNDAIFEVILSENKKYADLINDQKSTAVEQEIQLQICATMFEDLILKTGLINEYSIYCEARRIKA